MVFTQRSRTPSAGSTLGRLRRGLCALGLASFACLPVAALAQDSDGDGARDVVDVFPCDAARAAISYFPGQTTSALLVFEDQWPGATDLDYNDVAVRAHYRLERSAAGAVVSIHAAFDPVALGGELSNGLGLQLPVGRAGVTARRRIGSGAWQPVSLEADANATVLLSGDLRELFGQASGRINSVPGQPRLEGQRLELELSFASPAAMPVAAAPFDVFVFRTGNPGHQVHFPGYAGTAAMNAALFGSGEDGSTSTRRFVHRSGTPAALNLMTTTRYPLEAVAVSALFPGIVTFAQSGGAQGADFYLGQVATDRGHDVAARPAPAAPAASTSCVPAACSGTFRRLDGDVRITDFGAFVSFAGARGVIFDGSETYSYPSYFIGTTPLAQLDPNIVDLYIQHRYPGTAYCEYQLVHRAPFCPPAGGVLFTWVVPWTGATMLRSEADVNCAFSSLCPAVTPGACWAGEFGSTTVQEIWVR